MMPRAAPHGRTAAETARAPADAAMTAASKLLSAAWSLDEQVRTQRPRAMQIHRTLHQQREVEREVDPEDSPARVAAALFTRAASALSAPENALLLLKHERYESDDDHSQDHSQDHDHDHEHDASPMEIDGAGAGAPQAHPTLKKRKSTHVMRKEEKALLQEQVRELETRLAFLQGQVMIPSTEADGPAVTCQLSNASLREAIWETQLRFASARSMLSHFTTSELLRPVEQFLHLAADPALRRRTLQTISAKKLRDGRRFLLERCKYIDLARPHAADERFETKDGEVIAVRFDATQFPRAANVRALFDAVVNYVQELDAGITQHEHNVLLHEQTARGENNASEHHIVMALHDGSQLETNLALFSFFDQHEDYGVCVTAPVHQDDLYPYDPNTRFQQDVHAIVLVTKTQNMPALARYSYVRVHGGRNAVLTEAAKYHLRDKAGSWAVGMMRVIKEHVRRDAAAQMMNSMSMDMTRPTSSTQQI